MTARTRHRLYAVSIVGLLLALWLRPVPETDATVLPARVARSSPPDDARVDGGAALPGELPALAERTGRAPADLFVSPEIPPPPMPAVEVIAPPMYAAPDLQMLGWVQSGGVHWVSVMSNNTPYTLQPGEQVEEHYRYDGVRDEMVVFTSLRDGTTREYPISDITISDQD